MNSIESLSMGICTLTEMNDEYERFISDHPFININKNSLKITLEELINNRETILSKGSEGKTWVENYHNINKVGDKLYTYYKSIGLTNR